MKQDRTDSSSATAGRTKPSNSRIAEFKQEWIDQLVSGCSTEADLFGPDGVFTQLKGAVMNRLLEAEMTHHLGHERGELRRGTNARNGHSQKTVHTESGSVVINVPRDREATFEPILIEKHQRRLDGFDQKVLALYSRGMTTRDIASHLRELYGTDVSHELISKATEYVIDEFRAWQKRPLDACYPVVYVDAIFVGVRDGTQVKKRAFYVVLGMGLDGRRDVLGLWVAETEGAKFWLEVFTDLKNRGVNDVLFLCADGLTGIDRAIEVAFPKAVHQTCIVHLIRASMRFVSYADRGALAASLKPLYTAENESAARDALGELETKWGRKYRRFAPGSSAGSSSSRSSRTLCQSAESSTPPTASNRSTRNCARSSETADRSPTTTPYSSSSSSPSGTQRTGGTRRTTGHPHSLISTFTSKDVSPPEGKLHRISDTPARGSWLPL